MFLLGAKKCYVLILLGGIIVSSFIVYFGWANATSDTVREEILNINDQILKRKQEIIELNKKIEEVRRNIERKKQETKSLENQIQIIGNRVEQVELDIQATEKEIETKALEIETLELDAKNKKREADEQKEIIAELIRKLNKASDTSYLEILLLHDNFSEFFNEVAFVLTVERGLAEQVQGLKTLIGAVEERKKLITLDRESLEKVKEGLSSKKISLEESQTAKEILVQSAIANARKLTDNLSEILRQKEAMDNEVFSLQSKIQERLNNADRFSFSGNILLSWPVPNQGIVTYFMDTDYPFRNFFEHTGIDIRTLRNGRPSNGAAVKAAAPGIVVKIVRESIYGGNIIFVAHAGSITTVYMHLSQVLVSVGEEVARGDVIAYSGGMPGTPGAGRFTTGPHLHFEVRKDGVPVNPLNYLINF